MANNSMYPEMEPYIEQSIASPIGIPNKQGYLKLGFEIDSRGKCILRELDRRAPLIVQQALYFDEEMPQMPCVYILSSGGPNIDGDRYLQDITVKKNAYAFISTGAATKLAEMHSNYSKLIQNFKLEENAYLEFLPEPIIPCKHTRFISETNIEIDSSATLLYAEIFTAGRKYYQTGESFAYDILSICTQGKRPNGTSLFREKFIIRPEKYSPCVLGIMENYEVFANVIVMTPPEQANRIYSQTSAFINQTHNMAIGITHLPNSCGLLYKILGNEPNPVKKQVREFCSLVRQVVKGHKLPQEFPWR